MSHSLPAEVDVLIVGYGPVGAALTGLLGRYGVRTLVIDRATGIYLAPRAIALDNEALRILQMVGLSDGAFDKVVIPHVRMRCPYVGEFSKINTSGSIDGHPKLVTFYQPELEQALRTNAESHAQVTALTGVEFQDFVETPDGLRARLVLPDGRVHEIASKFLVGADGASSKVRKAIGQDFSGKTYGEDWLIVDARNVPDNIDHVEFICDHRRPTPHMVAPGGRTRWEFMLAAGESRDEMEKDETIHRLLAPWAAPDQLRIERKAVYRFHARSCERYSRGRVFLVGDAAHVTPPFVGQGLVAGLRDAANIGWKLAWVLRGVASPSILDSYDQERRPHATKMIALAKRMGQLVMPQNLITAFFIHGLLKLARRVPPLRRLLEEQGVKPKPDFGKGLFVRGRGKLRRGGMLPQLHLPCPSGATQLSDDALGPNLVLVGFGVDPSTSLDDEARSAWDRIGGSTLNLAGFNGAGLVSGWCAVIRPDRTILHDGPASQAGRIVREALALLTPMHA